MRRCDGCQLFVVSPGLARVCAAWLKERTSEKMTEEIFVNQTESAAPDSV